VSVSEETTEVRVLLGDVFEAYPSRLAAAFQDRWGIGLTSRFEIDPAGHEHFIIKAVAVDNRPAILHTQHLFWIQGFEAGERSALAAVRGIISAMEGKG